MLLQPNHFTLDTLTTNISDGRFVLKNATIIVKTKVRVIPGSFGPKKLLEAHLHGKAQGLIGILGVIFEDLELVLRYC